MNDDTKSSKSTSIKLDSKSAALEYLTPRSRRRINRGIDPLLSYASEKLSLGDGHVSIRRWSSAEGAETGEAPGTVDQSMIVGNSVKTVLLVHGWSANQTDMFDFVAPLVRHGFAVITVDLPSHGESSGQMASLEDLADGVSAVAKQLGEIYAVIAHSVGCPAVSVSISNAAFRPRKVVFLAPPESYEYAAREYGKFRGLNETEVDLMVEELRNLGTRVELFSSKLVRDFDFPGLLIHSDDDTIVPFAVGELVSRNWPSCRFVPVQSLGHRGILKDPQVINLVNEFVLS